MARLLSFPGRPGALGELLHLAHDVEPVLALLVVECTGCTMGVEDDEADRDPAGIHSIRHRADDLCDAILLQGRGYWSIEGVDVGHT